MKKQLVNGCISVLVFHNVEKWFGVHLSFRQPIRADFKSFNIF